MDPRRLASALKAEIDEWAALPFDAIKARLQQVCAYERGEAPNQYQVEVQLLESTPEYLHVGIGVDDGGWSAFKPLSTSFLVHRDGRIER